MINTLIIDDETNNTELLANLLHLYAPEVRLVGTAASVTEGYQAVLQHRPDLLFLDVQLPDGTGFDLLKQLGDAATSKVIFVTAHQEFALEAFHFCALDYLLKPLSPVELLSAIRKAQDVIGKEDLRLRYQTLLGNLEEASPLKKKIILKTQERVYAVSSGDIIRFESDGSYTTVFLSNGKKVVVSRLLKEFDDLLAGTIFFRVHQSHLINMNYLFCFEKSESLLVMKDDSSIPVAVRKREQLLRLMECN